MEYRANSETETCNIARQLAASLRAGECVALSGELGAGKSVFARALMRALGVTDAAMPSPTFAIVQEYQGRGCRVAHMDWYRLHGSGELEAIGIRDYLQPPWITIVEWPERAPGLLPPSARRVTLAANVDEPEARLITITN